MPKKLTPKEEAYIEILSEQGLSSRKVAEDMRSKGMIVSHKTVLRVRNGVGLERQMRKRGLLIQKRINRRSVRTPQLIRKVKKAVLQNNPVNQTALAHKHRVSKASINRIIHQDLNLDVRKKLKIQVLTEKGKQNRKTNCRKLGQSVSA